MNSSFPFPAFPNGWFRVACSDEIHPGDVKPLTYFGKEIVLFRTEEGTLYVIDAYCPHLGAHLGYGGKIQDSAIQCPFHGWSFNGNGKCIRVPYATQITPEASVYVWPVCEVNNLIFVYYHAQRKLPDWEIPEFPECNSDEWTRFRQTHHWRVHSFVQEAAENGVDVNHMAYVHNQSILTIKSYSLEAKGPILTCRTYPEFDVSSAAWIFGKVAEGSIENNYYGLGFQANHVYIQGRIKFSLLLLVFMTPINEEYFDLYCTLSMKKVFNQGITHLLAEQLIKGITKTMEQDIHIWENKVYLDSPILSENDRQILEYRRWARQFYSE